MSNPVGGLARRAWVIQQIEKKFPGVPVLKLDSGNFRDVATPAGDTRTEALLGAMQILGYRVANIAELDVRLGYEEFIGHTDGIDLQFISANIIREETREPVFQPHVVLEVVSGDGKTTRRVGVVGVVRANPLFRKPGPEASVMVIDDPVRRVQDAVTALRAEKVDAIVVLAALHKFHARKILEEVEGIDFVLGSHGDTVTATAERHGNGWILYGGNLGTHISETRLFLDGRLEPLSRLHYLSNSYSFDPKMLEYVNSIYRDVEPDDSVVEAVCEDGTGS